MKRLISGVSLSPGEMDVALLMLEGLRNKEIADKRFTTEKAVKYHITNIYKKARVTCRSQFLVTYTSVVADAIAQNACVAIEDSGPAKALPQGI